MFNLCCCHAQLAPFPVVTCQPLTSLAGVLEHAKLQSDDRMILKQGVGKGNGMGKTKLYHWKPNFSLIVN